MKSNMRSSAITGSASASGPSIAVHSADRSCANARVRSRSMKPLPRFRRLISASISSAAEAALSLLATAIRRVRAKDASCSAASSSKAASRSAPSCARASAVRGFDLDIGDPVVAECFWVSLEDGPL